MKNFKDYLEEKEVKGAQKELDEDIFSAAGSVLGYSGAGLLVAFGGALIIKGYTSLIKKAVPSITKTWEKVFGKKTKTANVVKVVEDIKKEQVVKVAIDKSKKEREENFAELEKVFLAIEEKDAGKAVEELRNSKVKLTPVVYRVLIGEITKTLGEPPIHFGNTGNDCYLFVKRLLGIKVAQASANLVKEALRKQSADLIQDVDKNEEEKV